MRELRPAPPCRTRPLQPPAGDVLPPAVGAAMGSVRIELHRRARGRGGDRRSRRGGTPGLDAVESSLMEGSSGVLATLCVKYERPSASSTSLGACVVLGSSLLCLCTR